MSRFPDGAWFSVVGNVKLGAGGQTRMVLLRHRLFLQDGLDFPILTYNPLASYEPIRAGLLADGLLLPQSRLLNLHEDLREREMQGGKPAPAIESSDYLDDVDDGYLWRRRHADAWEFFRPDGTVYAVTPPDVMLGDTRVIDREGRVVMAGDGLGDLWRWWTGQVVPDTGDVFLVSDSRFVADELGLLDDPRIHLMHQMHNPHLRGARRWDSPIEPSYAESIEHVDRLDALNTLTERQRHDLRLRLGDLEQLHVVANPVEAISRPEPAPARVPGRIVMIARLHPQKQLDQAIEAFALVAAESAAHLEIYGDGDDETALRAQVEELGLTDRVTFHGHVVDAADALWTADLSWLTSRFEGYGLAILEARVRECPVLAFDVPYGPAEQIDSGVDGILVPPADAAALARATLDLLADRARLEAMRAPARAGAIAHGHESFLDAWVDVAVAARAGKARRTHFDDVTWTRNDSTAEVMVTGRGDLAGAVLQWQGWNEGDAQPTDLTASVTRSGERLMIRRAIVAEMDHERLMLTCRTASWSTYLRARRGLARRIIGRLRRS